MNLPGRANTNVPEDTLVALALPLPVLTRRCVKSPLADCVVLTKLLNCAKASALASAGMNAAHEITTANKVLGKENFINSYPMSSINLLGTLSGRHQDFAV